jgi:hypothetical protein
MPAGRPARPLLNMGRSKGACVVLGFQDVAGMRAAYGAAVAHELTGQCGYKSFLRTGSQDTALWAQEHFGMVEQLTPQYAEQQSYDRYGAVSGSNEGITYVRGVQSALLASELLSLPAPGPATGLVGVHDTPHHGAYRSHAPWDWVISHLWDPDTDEPTAVPRVCPRDPSEQKLHAWTEADLARLWPAQAEVATQASHEPQAESGLTQPGAPPPPAAKSKAAELSTIRRDD